MAHRIDITRGPYFAQEVSRLMQRHGVRPLNQVTKLTEILSVSQTAARRLHSLDSNQWVLGQAKKVFDFFGEDLLVFSVRKGEVFPPPVGEAQEEKEEKVPAALLLAGQRLPCHIVVGEPVSPLTRAPYVAYEMQGAWFVANPAEVERNKVFWSVRTLQLDVEERKIYNVAVLDDEVDVAEGTRESLAAYGCYESDAFTRLRDLRQAMTEKRYDAFVLDWSLGREGTSRDVILDIRASRHPRTPIFLLSAQMVGTEEYERQIDEIIQIHHVIAQEKPAKWRFLEPVLKQALETAAALEAAAESRVDT